MTSIIKMAQPAIPTRCADGRSDQAKQATHRHGCQFLQPATCQQHGRLYFTVQCSTVHGLFQTVTTSSKIVSVELVSDGPLAAIRIVIIDFHVWAHAMPPNLGDFLAGLERPGLSEGAIKRLPFVKEALAKGSPSYAVFRPARRARPLV
jgi:hypothetical protein